MSVLDIRKSFGSAFALWCALLAGSVLALCGGSVQAQTPLEEFKNFLTNPPPVEEIVLERKLFTALPTPPGITNMLSAGPFFQLRLQTNAYFLRQMDVIGEAPQNHRFGNLLEGEWDDTYWTLSSGQLNLWPDKKQARLKREVERSIIFDPILSLGLDERINRSTLVWKGDTFTAQGANSLRFEGRIERKTANGLPARIVTWSVDTSEFHRCIDYEYRGSFHPWFPVAIKPFFEKRAGGIPFLGGTGKMQEFYVRSLKMGSVTSQENFLPTLFTNANTLTILHTKGGTEYYNRNGKLTLVSSPPPPSSNTTQLSPSASPTNAPLPAAPSPNRASSPPPSPPPSRLLLIAALLCLSAPVLIVLVITLRSKSKGS